MLTQAVEKAYSGSLMTGKHPYAMLNVFLPPGEIDVNIHPAKTEIKFHRERDVFAMVKKAVGEALNRAPLYRTGHETVTTFLPPSDDAPAQFVSEQARRAYATLPLPDVGLPVLRIMGQLSSTYIVAEGPDGLYLIDQHAAHERIVYEDIMARWSRREIESQGLLEPLTLELNPGEEEGLKEQRKTFFPGWVLILNLSGAEPIWCVPCLRYCGKRTSRR
jgi:DNA mismatch repair protein MutL